MCMVWNCPDLGKRHLLRCNKGRTHADFAIQMFVLFELRFLGMTVQ